MSALRAPEARTGPARAATIRVATIGDLESVISLRVALVREHSHNRIYGRLRPDAHERARELFAAQLQSAHEITFLAERDGAAVGILRCVASVGSPLLTPARYAYISSVYIAPELRRRGLLRALLARAEQWCAEKELTEIRLHNAADNPVAAQTWEALGFEIVETLRVRSLRATSGSLESKEQ